jgi:hypothetical protein
MKKLISFYVLSSFLSSAFAQGEPWTRVKEEKIFAPKPTTGIQQITLQIIADAKSPWAKDGELEAQVKKASVIFRQCSVEIGEVNIKYVNFSESIVSALNKPDPYKPPQELLLTKGDMTSARPAMFLFGTQIPQSARAYNASTISRMSTSHPVEVLKPLLNVTILSGQHSSNAAVPNAGPGYSTFAHELGHILGDLPHVETRGNLMTAEGIKGGKLNAEQCKKIQNFYLVSF